MSHPDTTPDLTSSGHDESRIAHRPYTTRTGFQRDVLLAIATHAHDDRPQHGIAILETLNAWAGEEITRSRLYQNLDALAAEDYLTVTEQDGRTNHYALTDRARTQLATRADRLAAVTDPMDP